MHNDQDLISSYEMGQPKTISRNYSLIFAEYAWLFVSLGFLFLFLLFLILS